MGRCSEETKAKLRAAALRRLEAGLPHQRTGTKHTSEALEKLRAAGTGKRYSDHGWYVSVRLSTTKKNAALREILWELTDEEARQMIIGECRYCGCPSKVPIIRDGKRSQLGVHGIDRVDNSLGYTTGNCVTCCLACNRAKSEMTLDEFKCWITRVYSHTIHHEQKLV
jgi:hypothetical protein